MRRSGFTLIELLVVIAIVAVLAVTVILTLNPAELLKQAADSTRIADVNVINKALSIYQSDVKTLAMGSSSVVYVSLPDSSASCANLGLPALSAGYSYACKPTASYTNVDGTGWIPVNLTQISSGSPLSILPKDPSPSVVNQSYYTYSADANGRWIISSKLLSSKYLETSARDGGTDPSRYEAGSNLTLGAQLSGLVGYWSFDEGVGATAIDTSGSNATATWAGTGSRWDVGKVGGGAIFNGVNDYLTTTGNAAFTMSQGSYAYWLKADATQFTNARTISIGTTVNLIENFIDSSKRIQQYSVPAAGTVATSGTINDGSWHFIVTTWGTNGAFVYIDGVERGNNGGVNASQTPVALPPVRIGEFMGGGNYYLRGTLDEMRVYNRQLTLSEIQTLHAATQ